MWKQETVPNANPQFPLNKKKTNDYSMLQFITYYTELKRNTTNDKQNEFVIYEHSVITKVSFKKNVRIKATNYSVCNDTKKRPFPNKTDINNIHFQCYIKQNNFYVA